MLAEPMSPLPSDPSDPRLDGWYHTIELRPGLTTRGYFDHRAVADRFGLPQSLAGKTALDIGTADGFWAFEMERRGADRVVAIDLPKLGACDLLPRIRAEWSEAHLENRGWPQRFATAHRMRGSRVEYRYCSVYDLSPETVGTFDVVLCGSLLLHLFNPLQALINIRSVTREMAVIETAAIDQDVEKERPGGAWVQFGVLGHETRPGQNVTYWRLGTKALHDMMVYAGFDEIQSYGVVPLAHDLPVSAAVGRVKSQAAAGATPSRRVA
jgi:tRNA (mo5U34)-methyltransferase